MCMHVCIFNILQEFECQYVSNTSKCVYRILLTESNVKHPSKTETTLIIINFKVI